MFKNNINRKEIYIRIIIYIFFAIINYLIIFFENKNHINNNFDQIINLIKPYRNIVKIFPNKLKWKEEKIDLLKIKREIQFYDKENFSLINTQNFYYKEIKISIIISIYNQANFILKIYSCIINQSIKDIEIIFIDDNSIDNPGKIINNLMIKDKRIIYIRNRINKGQFYCRNIGVLKSKGEYVLIIDADDLILNDIIFKSYLTAKYFKLDIIQYYHMIGTYKHNRLQIIDISGIYYPFQAKEIFYNISTRYLWDKLIKRNIFIKSIQFMNQKFRKERFPIHNDDVACFGIFNMAKSYGILKQVGYFYNRESPNSTTKFSFVPNNINNRIYSVFRIMEYYFDQSKNNNYEKSKGGYNFFEIRIIPEFQSKLKYLTSEFSYISKIINLYSNSKYINETQKLLLLDFQKKLQKIRNETI